MNPTFSLAVTLTVVFSLFLSSLDLLAQEPDEGAVEVEAHEEASAPEAPVDAAEAPSEPMEDEDEKKPVRRTPMALPGYASFGESQRGLPAVVNPATPALGEKRFRFGTLIDFGVGLEVGDVGDDFVEDIRDLFDDFEDLEERAEALREAGPAAPDQEVDAFFIFLEDFEERANALVAELASKAYVNATTYGSFPLAPVTVRSDTLGGMFTLNADGVLELRGAVFSANDAFDTGLRGVRAEDNPIFDEDPDGTQVVIVDGERHRIEAEPDAGIAVQGGTVGRIGAGYSRRFGGNERSGLIAGTTVNFYHATLFRGGVLFDEDEDAIDDVIDDMDRTSTNFGVDLGVAWVGQRFLIGGVVRNINEPSFDYPDTSDSDFFNANPRARRNGERWRMDRQFTVQGATFSADRRWLLTGALDLNSATDSTGDRYQWASVLGAFEPQRGWIPSPRLGMRTNLVDEKLTYVSAGLTLFRALHVDVSSTLDTVTLDGNTVPRGLLASIALGRRY